VIAVALSSAVINFMLGLFNDTVLAITWFLSFIYPGCSFSCHTAGLPNLFQYGLSLDSLVIGIVSGLISFTDCCCIAWVAWPAAYLCANSSLLPHANIPASLLFISACSIPCHDSFCWVAAMFCICHGLNALAHPHD